MAPVPRQAPAPGFWPQKSGRGDVVDDVDVIDPEPSRFVVVVVQLVAVQLVVVVLLPVAVPPLPVFVVVDPVPDASPHGTVTGAPLTSPGHMPGGSCAGSVGLVGVFAVPQEGPLYTENGPDAIHGEVGVNLAENEPARRQVPVPAITCVQLEDPWNAE